MKAILLLLALSICTFGQTTIRWGSPNAPKGCCTSFLKNGFLFTNYQDDNIEFSLTLMESDTDKKYLFVSFAMKNKSTVSSEIYPQKFYIRMGSPVNKLYASVPASAVVKEVEGRGKWRLALLGAISGANANLNRQEAGAVIIDNKGNAAAVIMSSPDHSGDKSVQDAVAKQDLENAEGSDFYQAHALLANTVIKDQIVRGLVYFKKEKIANTALVIFTFGGVIYEVPFG